MNNISTRKRIFFISSLAALYIPALYILSNQYLSATYTETYQHHILPTGGSKHQDSNNEIGKLGPQNSTLGFEKIFYISIPERTDRQDNMKLIGSYLGLDLTYVPGVNGSTIADKAIPYDAEEKLLTVAELGCWRAHANIWAEIVQSGISSALILEDDIDFTVGIRDVLTGVSEHLRHLTGAKKGEVYGLADEDSWDTLHVGHCWNEPLPATKYPVASKIYEAWEDEYAPAKSDYVHLAPGVKSQKIRALQPTYTVVCTQAYVVSLAGAQRLLYHIGGPGSPMTSPVDLAMMGLYETGTIKGYTVLPSIFNQWKNGNFKDTDIQTPPRPDDPNAQKGSGGDIIKGVREEMKKSWGGRDIWKDIESKSKPAISKRIRRRQS